MGQTGFCKNPRFPAAFCENLRFPAAFCENMRLRNAVCNSQEKRKSAKISENQRKSASLAPFVPFNLSLLIPLDFNFKELAVLKTIRFETPLGFAEAYALASASVLSGPVPGTLPYRPIGLQMPTKAEGSRLLVSSLQGSAR